MDIGKILLATDGSEESEKAVDYTLYLAPALGASVLALYVSEIHFPLTSLLPIYEEAIIEIAEKTEDSFKERFGVMAERFKEEGIPFSSRIVRDGTMEGIIETAKKEGAGLIVMGKRGQGFIGSSLIGSNTIKVLRHIGVPVLAVRSKGETHSTDIRKILVPLDISDASVSALPEAISLAQRLGAEVIAVYVFWLNGTAYEIPPRLVDELLERSKSELAKIVAAESDAFVKSGIKDPGVQIKSRVLHGFSPTYVLREYAKQNSVDLIVLKTHGRKGVSRLIYGSETERIIQESPCPVLAVK
jgi:nucleotide-binding universal stress UspA family protein